MAGKIRHGGLVEVPMGISIREIVYDICGGIRDDRKFKAVQMGGPSGGCIPAELQDTVIDYESINKTGAIMGSGGLVVMDETTCMVDIARFFLDFTQRESCGKCTFCRIGTKRMLEILTRITEGKGQDGDIELLEELAGARQELLALRPRPDGAEPGADDAQVLPLGVRGAHHQQEVPGAPLPDAADLHDHRRLHRLHAVRQGLPGRARSRASARRCTSSTSRTVHRVRRVLQGLQLRRDHKD